jgi:hypothetical protein
MNMINELCNAASKINFLYSNFGYMHPVMPNNLYVNLTGVNVNLPADPEDMPPPPPLTCKTPTLPTNYAILLQWQRRESVYNKIKNMNKALMDVAKAHLNQETRKNWQFSGPLTHKNFNNLHH